jgi:hypothetical protein
MTTVKLGLNWVLFGSLILSLLSSLVDSQDSQLNLSSVSVGSKLGSKLWHIKYLSLQFYG